MCEWIDSDFMDQAIDELLLSSKRALEEAPSRQKANVVDPFQSLVVASTFEVKSVDHFESLQAINSSLRGISNALGHFHQTILGAVPGWINHDAGYDLECKKRRLIAEVKNKHNTMNSNNRSKVEDDLRTAIKQKPTRDWTAYLVIVVPKKPNRYQKSIGANMYEIDGASFYELATGYSDALHQLFDAVCRRVDTTDDLQLRCRELFRESMPR